METVERRVSFRRWGVAAIGLAVLGFGAVGWIGLKFLGDARSFGRVETMDRTLDWPRFYRDEFSTYFWIPSEAEIIQVSQKKGFMYELQNARFRLPETHAPSEWVALIAQSSGIGNFRQSDLWYDASHRPDHKANRYKGTITDTYLVRYCPQTKVYEAEWSWD